jgi:outer membrane immunogenic protein
MIASTGSRGFNHAAMRLAAVAMIATVSMGTAASAADMPLKAPPPVVSAGWSGFYIGLGAGFRATTVDAKTVSYLRSGIDQIANCPNVVVFGGCVLGEPLNSAAIRVTSYFGFNWQIAPRWLVGLEGDVGLAERTTTLGGFRYPASFGMFGIAPDSFGVKTSWDASARARVGFLADPSVLLYATGGAAWLRLQSTSTCADAINLDCHPSTIASVGPVVITHTTTRSGWTAGGGIEAMLAPNLIGRVEDRYADFGTITAHDSRLLNGVGSLDVTYDLRVRTHTATLGFAYKLWDGPAAMASVGSPATPTVASSWAGPYVGLGASLRAATSDPTVTGWTQNGVNGLAQGCTVLAQFGGCVTGEPMSNTAFRVSPYAGYNWYAGPQTIVGIEGDLGLAKKSTTLHGVVYPTGALFATFSNGSAFSVETAWDASIRARIGVLPNPTVLAYVTGGAAWLRVSGTSTCLPVVGITPCQPFPLSFGPTTLTDATTRLGWTAGGGIEGKLTKNLIARGEYRYADFGTIRNTDTRSDPAGATQVVTYDLHLHTHTVTLGLAYLFDWERPVAARY